MIPSQIRRLRCRYMIPAFFIAGERYRRLAHELPLNAGMVNSDAVRAGCVQSLGAYATASGVAALLGDLGHVLLTLLVCLRARTDSGR